MNNRTVSLVLATSTGGVGTHVRSLAAGLVEAGWNVTVCGPAATEQLFDFTAIGAQFRPVALTGAVGSLANTRALRRATRASELVHAHGLRAGLVGVIAGRRPLVVTWHNAVIEQKVLARAFATATQRVVARGATVNLAASDDLAERARALGARDVRDGPIGIQRRTPSRSVAEVRDELGLQDGQQVILSIGRLHPQKNLDVLVAAASRWRDREVVVGIAGDGPLRSMLAQQIAATDAPVHLLGRRGDIADLLSAADLVVLPSQWEARSLAAQEALLAGRPLVATAVGGLPKLLGAGAELVTAGDVDALDQAVRQLLDDPQERSALAARGRTQAAMWPTDADTVAQIQALYTELLGPG
jgi:glycosyltransferase involved in cell wall biosynthesis